MIDKLFLGVGAMKAGTTWLYFNLERHRRIWFSPEKELHWFAFADGRGGKLSYEERVERVGHKFAERSRLNLLRRMDDFRWYARYAAPGAPDDAWFAALFADVPADAWAADFSNLHALLSDQGWAHVRRSCSTLRVLYTLRDPIERLWSHFKFQLRYGPRPLAEIDEAFFRERIAQEWFWVHARYDAVLARLRRNLKPEELLVTYFEDFRAQPEPMLERIYDFLGIEPIEADAALLAKKVNPSASADLPEPWREFLRERLAPIMARLDASGDAHPSWTR